MTQAEDLCDDISKKYNLHSQIGFSLYFTIDDRMVSVPNSYFFFDMYREVMNSVNRLRKSKTELSEMKISENLKVIFMRKIWIDCLPGRDIEADTKFHFYQEVVKYLKNFHQCSRKDAVDLAALIYISGHADNREELSNIQ